MNPETQSINPKFTKTYLILNEVLSASVHGIGVVLSIVATVFLLYKASSPIETFAYLIYGLSMTLLFLISTLYHSLTFTKARTVFRVLDHSSIYIMIAGTYTPFCLMALPGKRGIVICIINWCLALLGITYKSIAIPLKKSIKTASLIYLVMGWLCIFEYKTIYQNLGYKGFIFLLIGGITYTSGLLFYALEKKMRFSHMIWHIFVLLGATFMFISIYWFV